MKVVIIGLDTVGPKKRPKVTETIDLLKRERQVGGRKTLTLQFAGSDERHRRWRGSGRPPKNGFYVFHMHGIINNSIPLRTMICCIGSAWRHAELDIDGMLYEDLDSTFRQTREFARKIADRVLGPKEAAA